MTHSSFNIVNIFYTMLKKLCEVVRRLEINGFIRACPINDTKGNGAEMYIK